MTILALINDKTFVLENLSTDPRPAEQIQVPGFIVLDLEKVNRKIWAYDKNLKDWVLVDDALGSGKIGDKYQDGFFVDPEKPDPVVQPESSGLQNA